MKEIFKDIPNYEGVYQVSNLGRVKSLNRVILRRDGKNYTAKEKILKSGVGGNGYLIVNLSCEGKFKTKSVHQLVAIVFLNHTPCGHKIVVDHINCDEQDNRLENLQLISQRENTSKDKKGSSKYTGVNWHKASNKWRSLISINGKLKHLGCFKCELEASAAYQSKLKEILSL